MRNVIVTAVDATTGEELGRKVVDIELTGTNFDEAAEVLAHEDMPLTHADAAFYLASPEVCPFDCDYCRD
jgi:hypothetical protein